MGFDYFQTPVSGRILACLRPEPEDKKMTGVWPELRSNRSSGASLVSKPHLTPSPSNEAIAQAAGVKQTTAMEADLAAEAAQASVVEIAQV